ncbi:DUF502 domain-containing protein [Phaeovulum sp.]|uniref:DUF502 domain-containing protein n=1 Tax=Phaeovulum sp. TaxID=2934796 RepID=UPI0035646ABC
MTEQEDPHPQPVRRRRILASLRASFLTGLVVVMPIGLTLWLIWTVTGWIDGVVLPFIPAQWRPDKYMGVNLRGVGVIIFLVFTIIMGWMAKGFFGRSLLNWGEDMVDRMPVVRSIYNGIKQIAETVFAQNEATFDRACMFEYPRMGIWAIGFVSTKARGELAEKIPHGETILSVFLPTTPNPTSGYLLYVPESDVIYLDMSVEDAAKLIISAGLVYPTAPLVGSAAAAKAVAKAKARAAAKTPAS